MYLILGLGNPGKKYKNTRHNLGFLILDFFRKKNKFPKFKFEKSLNSQISEKNFLEKRVILMKPQTFMNTSGKALKLFSQKYNFFNFKNLLVVHDDLDIPLGKIKISFGRSSGGHKGVQSLIEELGTKNFFRQRVGIGPRPTLKKIEIFVLEKFEKKEKGILKKIIKESIKLIEEFLKKPPSL